MKRYFRFFFNFIFLVFYCFLFIILIFLSISFLTLFERFLIRLSQNRLGPNKNRFFGFFQSFFDGLKLLKKENFIILKINYFVFLFSFIFFLFSFYFWFLLSFSFYFFNSFYKLIFLLIFVGILVFFNILFGIFSNNKFSFFGSLRFGNQSISFEIIFFFFIFIIIIFNKRFNFKTEINLYFIILFILFIILFITELNRAPFDFSEGERELVRGFNTEFSSIIFTFLFIGEYNLIIFFSIFCRILFNFLFIFILFLRIVLFLRSSFPRFRYDFLINIF